MRWFALALVSIFFRGALCCTSAGSVSTPPYTVHPIFQTTIYCGPSDTWETMDPTNCMFHPKVTTRDLSSGQTQFLVASGSAYTASTMLQGITVETSLALMSETTGLVVVSSGNEYEPIKKKCILFSLKLFFP